jgi:hypothetical protein
MSQIYPSNIGYVPQQAYSTGYPGYQPGYPQYGQGYPQYGQQVYAYVPPYGRKRRRRKHNYYSPQVQVPGQYMVSYMHNTCLIFSTLSSSLALWLWL